jgi:lipoprotein-anchoring transpeptidase ErfK/SrfK
MIRLGLLATSMGMLLGTPVLPPAAAPVNARLAAAQPVAAAPIPVPAVASPAQPETIHWEQLSEVGRPLAVWDAAPATTAPGRPAAPRPVSTRSASFWPPDLDGDNLVKVVVSLPQQTAYVYRGGELLWSSPVSTGKRGHGTPTGTFPIMEKKVHHRSNLYSNAPMPYMQRLTSGGIALHAGHVPGYRASHGCIRLPWGNAKKLFDITRPGTTVVVTNDAVAPTA